MPVVIRTKAMDNVAAAVHNLAGGTEVLSGVTARQDTLLARDWMT